MSDSRAQRAESGAALVERAFRLLGEHQVPLASIARYMRISEAQLDAYVGAPATLPGMLRHVLGSLLQVFGSGEGEQPLGEALQADFQRAMEEGPAILRARCAGESIDVAIATHDAYYRQLSHPTQPPIVTLAGLAERAHVPARLFATMYLNARPDA